VQAACGIGNDHVVALGGGALDRVKDDGGGVGTLTGLHQRHTGAVGPQFQLFAGSGAEGIARGQHHTLAFLLIQVGQLGDGGGLAHAVDANDQNHGRFTVQLHRVAGGQFLADDLAQFVQCLLAVLEVLFLHGIPQLVHQAHSAHGADIGQNQLFFQCVIQVVVDLGMGQRVDNVLEKARAGLFQAVLHFLLLLELLLRDVALEKVEKSHGKPPLYIR